MKGEYVYYDPGGEIYCQLAMWIVLNAHFKSLIDSKGITLIDVPYEAFQLCPSI